MRILFITRSTLFTNRGGDTIQVTATAEHLAKLGVHVDIRLCTDSMDYPNYDLLHFFNIIRPADILYHIRKSGKPYVVSTIFVDYSEFDKQQNQGGIKTIFRMLPSGFIEYLKVAGRRLLNGEKIVSPEYLWLGQKRSVQKIIKGAALLLPNSESEYQRLKSSFEVDHNYKVIPNAIDVSLFQKSAGIKRKEKMILCVGRIEGLKNQLNLVRAVKGSHYQLYIIGAAASNHPRYYAQCRNEAGANIKFIDPLPQQDLVRYYNEAKVHVLPSWFETTGLSSLEAGAMGCQLVITAKGDTKEYFGTDVFYCEPDDPQSIRRAIDKAVSAPVNGGLEEKIRNNYTWEQAALKTLNAYRTVLINGINTI